MLQPWGDVPSMTLPLLSSLLRGNWATLQTVWTLPLCERSAGIYTFWHPTTPCENPSHKRCRKGDSLCVCACVCALHSMCVSHKSRQRGPHISFKRGNITDWVCEPVGFDFKSCTTWPREKKKKIHATLRKKKLWKNKVSLEFVCVCIPLRERGKMSHTVVMEGDTTSLEKVNRKVTLTRSHIVCSLTFSDV